MTSPASPRGLPSPAKSPFTVPTSPFAAASTRSDKRTTPSKSPRTSASSSGASASSALPSAAAATSNSTGPASTSTSTSTTTTFSTTSACIPSSLDPMSSPSDEFEITSSFLATIDVLEKSVTGRWIEEKEDLDRSKTVEPNSKGAQSAARGTHERRPNGDGNDCDDEEQLERNSARAALPAVRGRTKATVGSGGVDREEVMDSQWIDSPFCMSTQAARAFAAPAPLVSRAKRWANQPAATDDGAGASTWDESPASSWSPASPSSSPLQSGFSLLPPAL